MCFINKILLVSAGLDVNDERTNDDDDDEEDEEVWCQLLGSSNHSKTCLRTKTPNQLQISEETWVKKAALPAAADMKKSLNSHMFFLDSESIIGLLISCCMIRLHSFWKVTVVIASTPSVMETSDCQFSVQRKNIYYLEPIWVWALSNELVYCCHWYQCFDGRKHITSCSILRLTEQIFPCTNSS